MNEPAMADTALIPSASPRSSCGNASVRIAEELAMSSAPPTPWTIRIAISQRAAAEPSIHVSESRIDPAVKIAKPKLNMRTRPYMSPIRPKLTTSTAVATRKPMSIHSR